MSVKADLIQRLSSLPTVPVMANRLVHLLNDPDARPGEISRVIQYDSALTANILKAANSSFLGFTQPVTSLDEATVRLGTNWVFQIAVSSLIYSNLRQPAAGYGMSADETWRHSMAVAVMAEALRDLLHLTSIGTVFTAALLHDIGKIPMGEFVADAFPALQELVDEGNASFEEAEQAILEVDHAEIGALIARQWRFPEAIVDCIRWHHYPEKAPVITPAIDLVHVADAICLLEGLGIGRDDLHYRLCESSIERLRLNQDTTEKAVSQTMAALDAINAAFINAPAVRVGR
ncbi:MAG: HDOD domain-containing protein [candidate division Zixibacteria bacterium]|nr:HDOD domain-containing protein [candidate division Zixibacteria bacterium]